MKFTITIVTALLLFGSFFQPVIAGEGCPHHATAEAKGEGEGKAMNHIAVFTVPDITDKIGEDLAKAVSADTGIVSTKTDTKAATFAVTFDPAKVTSEKLEKAIVAVAATAKFDKMLCADGRECKKGDHKCSKPCPMAEKKS
jgi:hypothetical protein